MILNNWLLIIGACLTLGLAPFSPEPHLWANLKWVAGGARGMEAINWLDLLMHGLPWLLLIRLLVITGIRKIKA